MPVRRNVGQMALGSKPREQGSPRYFLDPVPAPRIVPRRGLQPTSPRGDTGERLLMALSATLPGHRVPWHLHPSEHIGVMYSDRTNLRIGEKERAVRKGDFHSIPAKVPHGVRCFGRKPFVMLDVFFPVRDDFLRKLATSTARVPVGPGAGRSDRVTRQSSLSSVAMSLPRITHPRTPVLHDPGGTIISLQSPFRCRRRRSPRGGGRLSRILRPHGGSGAGRRGSVSLVATVLTALFVLGMFGIPPAAAGHPTAPAVAPLLVDNFTQDSQLNGSLWNVNGNSVLNAAKQMYTGTVVTPNTSFSSTQGLQMSGVTKAYELTGIGSLHAFRPPFIANVTVMGTDSHGAAFLLVLTNGTATSWVAVDGYLNSSEGSAYGIGLDARPPGSARWTYLGNLVSSPALHQWYDVTINVSFNGVATVRVASGGSSLGTMQVNVGSGPFVLGLMQAENSPQIAGNNVADWAFASVLSVPLPPTHDVTFIQMGLPVGTEWSVTLNGTSKYSVGSTVTFAEPNGTYPYGVGTVPGYVARPGSGTVTVSGTAVNLSITFTPVPTYSITFTESGLPGGTSWSVTLNGTTNTSTARAITFTEPNGTYPFLVGTIAGYTETPSSGSVVVNGSSSAQTITFTSSTSGNGSNPPGKEPNPPSTLLGLPAIEGYALLGAVVSLATAGAVGGVLWSRRSRSPPPDAGGGPGYDKSSREEGAGNERSKTV